MSSFAMTTHQIWSCHVTLAADSENFYLSSNSILDFRKSYQIWEKLAQIKMLQAKSKTRGENHSFPPPPPVLIVLIGFLRGLASSYEPLKVHRIVLDNNSFLVSTQHI